jgi:hypothetical protein
MRASVEKRRATDQPPWPERATLSGRRDNERTGLDRAASTVLRPMKANDSGLRSNRRLFETTFTMSVLAVLFELEACRFSSPSAFCALIAATFDGERRGPTKSDDQSEGVRDRIHRHRCCFLFNKNP